MAAGLRKGPPYFQIETFKRRERSTSPLKAVGRLPFDLKRPRVAIDPEVDIADHDGSRRAPPHSENEQGPS